MNINHFVHYLNMRSIHDMLALYFLKNLLLTRVKAENSQKDYNNARLIYSVHKQEKRRVALVLLDTVY